MLTNVEMHMNTDGRLISYSDMVSKYRRTKLYIRELRGYAHACNCAGYLIPPSIVRQTAIAARSLLASPDYAFRVTLIALQMMCRLVISRIGLSIDEHLVLGSLLVLPVEDDELSQNEQVEENREARSREPRGVGDQVSGLNRNDEDGNHIGYVCLSAWVVDDCCATYCRRWRRRTWRGTDRHNGFC